VYLLVVFLLFGQEERKVYGDRKHCCVQLCFKKICNLYTRILIIVNEQ